MDALPSTNLYTSKNFLFFQSEKDARFQTLDSLFRFQMAKLLMLQSFLEFVWRKQKTDEKEKLCFTQTSSLNLWSVLLSKTALGQESFYILKG